MKCSLIQNCIGLMQTNADTITNSVSKLKSEDYINKSIDELLINKQTQPLIPHYPKKKKRHCSTTNTLDKDNKANLSIGDFISRCKDYEQKRSLELETKRFETINKEMNQMQDKPSINSKSKKYAKKTKPLYTRVQDEMNKKKTELEQLKIIYQKRIEESNNSNNYIHNGHNNRDKQIPKPSSYKSKEATERIQIWVNQQFEHIETSNKRKKKEEEEALILDHNEYSFRPKISLYSKRIAKKKLNVSIRSSIDNNCNSKSNDDKENNLIYNRLYSQRNEKYDNRKNTQMETMPSFIPTINYNHCFKEVHSKYNPILTQERRKRPHVKKNHSIDNKSHILEGNKNSIKPSDPHNTIRHNPNPTINRLNITTEAGDQTEERGVDHWSNVLLKMSTNNNSDTKGNDTLDSNLMSYKLNIRQNGAWNDLAENQVDYNKARGILGLLL